MSQAPQRRSLCAFDARSVMLFAALTVGGALAQFPPAPQVQSRSQVSASRTQSQEAHVVPRGGVQVVNRRA